MTSPIKRLSLGLGELERQALCADILQLAASTESHASHNRGGWRSSPTWLKTTWLHARLCALLASIPELEADPASLVGWAVVNRLGSHHRAHTHNARYAWSGIVYLEPGGPRSAATIFEWCPSRYEVCVERVEPVTDLLVLFPSRLGHSVEKHPHETPRITVAFDVARTGRAAS